MLDHHLHLIRCNFLSRNCFHWPWAWPWHSWCCSHPGIKVLAAFSWPFLQWLVQDNFSKHTYQAGLCMACCKERTRVLHLTSQRKKCRKSQEKPEWKEKPGAKHEITREDWGLGFPRQHFLLTTRGMSLPCALVSLHSVLKCWAFSLPSAARLAFQFRQTWQQVPVWGTCVILVLLRSQETVSSWVVLVKIT